MLVAQASPFLDVPPARSGVCMWKLARRVCGDGCIELRQEHLPVMGQPKGAWGNVYEQNIEDSHLGFLLCGEGLLDLRVRELGEPFSASSASATTLQALLCWCMYVLLAGVLFAAIHSVAAHNTVGLSLVRFGELRPVGGTQPLQSQPKRFFFILGHL